MQSNRLVPLMLLALVCQLATAGAQTTPNPNSSDLSFEQQVRVGDLITRDAGLPLASGQFQLAVGNVVPPEVQLRPVPNAAADAAPQMQGKSYAVVEEQIVIVDPSSRRITAALQRGRLNQ